MPTASRPRGGGVIVLDKFKIVVEMAIGSTAMLGSHLLGSFDVVNGVVLAICYGCCYCSCDCFCC